MPFVSNFRLERDNWRCLELEPEKLNLMKEMEERIGAEKKSWVIKVYLCRKNDVLGLDRNTGRLEHCFVS